MLNTLLLIAVWCLQNHANTYLAELGDLGVDESVLLSEPPLGLALSFLLPTAFIGITDLGLVSLVPDQA